MPDPLKRITAKKLLYLSNRASGGNGSLLCPTQMVGWANLKLSLKKGKSELKQIKISWGAWKDPLFWKWSAWFLYNGLWPGRSEKNNKAKVFVLFYCIVRQLRFK